MSKDRYGIPTVHYSAMLLEKLPARSVKRWVLALTVFEELRNAGIQVFIVPQVQDKLFYAEYPYQYVKTFCDRNFMKRPYIIFVLEVKLDKGGQYRLASKTIAADHNTKKLGHVVTEAFKPYSWFHWDGTLAERMIISL